MFCKPTGQAQCECGVRRRTSARSQGLDGKAKARSPPLWPTLRRPRSVGLRKRLAEESPRTSQLDPVGKILGAHAADRVPRLETCCESVCGVRPPMHHIPQHCSFLVPQPSNHPLRPCPASQVPSAMARNCPACDSVVPALTAFFFVAFRAPACLWCGCTLGLRAA